MRKTKEERRQIIEKIQLYIASLLFLFILVFIQKINIPLYFGSDAYFIGIIKLIQMNIIPILQIPMIALSIWFAIRFKYRINSGMKGDFEIINIKSKNYEHLTFMATYIIPLACINIESMRFYIILLFLIVIIGLIYVKTNMYYSNPTLALMGLHIYEAEAKIKGEKKSTILISNCKLTKDSKIEFRELGDDIYFVRCK